MSGFSNITFPEDVYRWLISMEIISNKGTIFYLLKG
jgi:hypothetical protein